MYAPVDSGHKWIADADGEVVENINPTKDGHSIIYEIIEGINAHFGTSFTEQDDMDKAYTIGQSIPNWNAYEKILLPEMVNFRFLARGSTANITGFMQGDKAYLNASRENAVWNVSPEGQVWGGGGAASNYEKQTKTLLLSNYGREISEVLPFVVEWQQDSQVPNWESYTLLS